jgi:hypothetical protein
MSVNVTTIIPNISLLNKKNTLYMSAIFDYILRLSYIEPILFLTYGVDSFF